MRRGERVELNEKVTKEVLEHVRDISSERLTDYYWCSYLPVISDWLASIADSLEILASEIEEKENKDGRYSTED